MSTKKAVETLVIDNFGGRESQYVIGDINSGLGAPFAGKGVYGINPFIYPGRLSFVETPQLIDSAGTVITDLVLAGVERVESNITYVYAVGHTGRVYKIQVNNPATYNPDYDNPVLLCTLALNTPTFKRGASINFFGSTERVYIGHDMGVTRIDFDGTNETFIGALGSWTQNIPRPLHQFVGKLYAGNGTNVAEIIDPATVSTYAKLNPGLPNNMQVRDLDTSIDGNYLKIVGTRLPLPDITSTTQDDKFLANTESYILGWNGSDIAATTSISYPSFSMNAYTAFGESEYAFGYDIAGGCLFDPTQKLITDFLAKSPLPNAIGTNGNLIGWAVPTFVQGFTKLAFNVWGSLDKDIGKGWWRYFLLSAQSPETDVIVAPFQLLISNFVIGSSTNGYAGGVASTAKVYFSSLEVSSAPTTKYRLYKWHPVETGLVSAYPGQYCTQVKMFSRRVKGSQIRIYPNPLTAGCSFSVALADLDGNTITGTSQTFTVGSNCSVGDDLLMYSPQYKPTPYIGLKINNLGTGYPVINKVEIDYSDGGI